MDSTSNSSRKSAAGLLVRNIVYYAIWERDLHTEVVYGRQLHTWSSWSQMVQTVFFFLAVIMDVLKMTLMCCGALGDPATDDAVACVPRCARVCSTHIPQSIANAITINTFFQLRAIYDRFFFVAVSIGCVVLATTGTTMIVERGEFNDMNNAHLILGIFTLTELVLNSHVSANAVCECGILLIINICFFVHELLCKELSGLWVYESDEGQEPLWFWVLYIPGHAIAYAILRTMSILRDRIEARSIARMKRLNSCALLVTFRREDGKLRFARSDNDIDVNNRDLQGLLPHTQAQGASGDPIALDSNDSGRGAGHSSEFASKQSHNETPLCWCCRPPSRQHVSQALVHWAIVGVIMLLITSSFAVDFIVNGET